MSASDVTPWPEDSDAGLYWIETGYGWTVAEWTDGGEWWLPGWTAGRELPTFLSIGPKVEQPADLKPIWWP